MRLLYNVGKYRLLCEFMRHRMPLLKIDPLLRDPLLHFIAVNTERRFVLAVVLATELSGFSTNDRVRCKFGPSGAHVV